MGVGRSAIFKYENGEVENLPRSTIARMSNLFGVSPAYLMCFDQWDEGTVSDDVKLIERIQAKWGKSTVKLLNEFLSLNDIGKAAAPGYIEDLSSMPKYQQEIRGGSR